MNKTQARSAMNRSRRKFIVGSAAAGGGLALGFHLPVGMNPGVRSAAAQAAAGTELNAWVVVKPDDTCVVRIARAEMGQGTHTGLAQLVAEELECDWKKVAIEQVNPGQNLARKRVWQDMSTGGSRGIRGSQDYVRQGGAAARIMLVQAAANEWQVPASEVTVANGIITHAGSGRSTSWRASMPVLRYLRRFAWRLRACGNINRRMVQSRSSTRRFRWRRTSSECRFHSTLLSRRCYWMFAYWQGGTG